MLPLSLSLSLPLSLSLCLSLSLSFSVLFVFFFLSLSHSLFWSCVLFSAVVLFLFQALIPVHQSKKQQRGLQTPSLCICSSRAVGLARPNRARADTNTRPETARSSTKAGRGQSLFYSGNLSQRSRCPGIFLQALELNAGLRVQGKLPRALQTKIQAKASASSRSLNTAIKSAAAAAPAKRPSARPRLPLGQLVFLRL